MGRKIIRSGEVEFEIDQFDPAVAGVTRLVSAIPGAFVATIDSDKLPNGKVRGKISVPAEAQEAEVIEIAKADSNVGKHLAGQSVKRAIYVRGRIVNFVVGG